MRDMIVLIPGIIGSVLQKDGKDIWSPSLRALFSAVTTLGGSLQQMMLHGDDPEAEDLGDGIQATALIPDARVVPGLKKIDGYTRVSEMIRDNFEVIEGSTDLKLRATPSANYFQFPYDWRRDNRIAARRLKNLIDLRLKQWRAYKDSEAKVILLAHSMGGIVARYYLEVLGGKEDCKALMTFGTPFRGSINALNFLTNGCGKYFVDLSDTIRSFTSVYQLLPTYGVVKVGAEYLKVADLPIRGLDPQMVKEALAFHMEIMEHVNARIREGNHSPYITFPVVGTYQPTLQSAELLDGKLTAANTLPSDLDQLLGHGDGTVPYYSAIPHELARTYRNSFHAESHSSIHCNEHVLDYIYYQLQDMQIQYSAPIRGPRSSPRHRRRVAISLSVQDWYRVGAPITIRARLLEDGQDLSDAEKYQKNISSLIATIEPAEANSAPLSVPLQQQEGEWALELEGMPPGVYRIEVRPAKQGPSAPLPVHDLFQVALAI